MAGSNDFIRDYLIKRKTYTDVNFFDRIKPSLDNLSESNGCKYYEKINKKIGIVADEFLFVAYEGIADINYITYSNYKTHSDLDVFIVASTWRGLNSEWSGLAYFDKDTVKRRLYEIIDYYRKLGIKIVFYSKEDPTNYNLFVPIAKRCDFIFTTAQECIKSYKKDCNNSNVYLLEFGINPLYHNPIGSRNNSGFDGFIFAGSWYKKYPKRNAEMTMLFDGILSSNTELKIIDRNYSIRKSSSYFYPEKYLKNISPSIDHQYLLKLHKLFNWAVNLNTIQFSNTMYASRVYELQALGNIILSNYSIGVNNKFPNVILVNDKSEVDNILKSFSNEDIWKHQNEGIRCVMRSETTYERLAYLLNIIGLSTELSKRKVLVVADNLSLQTRTAFNKQSYPYKTLISYSDFSKQQKKSYDIISFWKDSNLYEEYYLEDMVNAFKYTSCDYVTKDAFYNGSTFIKGIEHDYVNIIKDKYRSIFWSKSYSYDQLNKISNNQTLKNGYSVDHLEYNAEAIHEVNRSRKEYKLSVIIPVFNNGKHLVNKCFKSLKRSSLFNDMEIVIVDDGSTDDYTQLIVKRLGRQYSNIKYFLFKDGGSGSASRPRNKGFELSTSPLITYLDPDNEAINDGYFKLYTEMVNTDYDLAVGNIVRISDKKISLVYYRKGFNEIENTKSYLRNTRFKTQSIQALIVKRSIIKNNNLTMVEGALGQDTLFFQELLLNAKKVRVINEDIHIYYAAVEGSATNLITRTFFEKYSLLEPERHKKLKNYGLLTHYINTKFELYFDKWYLAKLTRVAECDLVASADMLLDIYKLYQPNCVTRNIRIKRFLSLTKNKKYNEIKEMLENN